MLDMLDKLERYGIDGHPSEHGIFRISVRAVGPSVGDLASGAFRLPTHKWLNPLTQTHRNILMRLGRHDNDFEARAEEDDNRTQMINAFWEMNGQTNIEMAGRSDVIQFWIRYLADKGPREMDPFSMEI